MAELWSLAGMRALSAPLHLGQQLRSGPSPAPPPPLPPESPSSSETQDGVCGEGPAHTHLPNTKNVPLRRVLCSFLVWGRVGQLKVNAPDEEEWDILF